MAKQDNNGNGPKYQLDIEGTTHPWNDDTITTEQIIALGGWELSQGAVVIDEKTQGERTLGPGEVVEIKPGMGFAKKVKFKRGFVISERIQEEVNLLKSRFSDLQFKGNGWVMISGYPLPEGWSRAEIPVCFQIPVAYPGTAPYGIYVPSDLTFNKHVPDNFQAQIQNVPPFEGVWGMLSWSPETWFPGADVNKGSNLYNLVVSFQARFKSGK
jgi:hypothetical protein